VSEPSQLGNRFGNQDSIVQFSSPVLPVSPNVKCETFREKSDTDFFPSRGGLGFRMNVFQQVFATVNPRAALIIRETENNERNKDKSAAKKSAPRPRIQFADVTGPPAVEKREPPVQVKPSETKPEGKAAIGRKTVTGRDKRPTPALEQASRQCNEPLRKARTQPVLESSLEAIEEPDARGPLQKAIDAVLDQKSSVDEALKAAHSQNFDLCRKNADLEHQINVMRRKAGEQHSKMKDMAVDHSESVTELRESWQFRIDEMLMEIALLRSGNADCDV
jgi:hypothetical protein